VTIRLAGAGNQVPAGRMSGAASGGGFAESDGAAGVGDEQQHDLLATPLARGQLDFSAAPAGVPADPLAGARSRARTAGLRPTALGAPAARRPAPRSRVARSHARGPARPSWRPFFARRLAAGARLGAELGSAFDGGLLSCLGGLRGRLRACSTAISVASEKLLSGGLHLLVHGYQPLRCSSVHTQGLPLTARKRTGCGSQRLHSSLPAAPLHPT